MKAKGCISAVVEWSGARKFFYWRLKRRLAEQLVRTKLRQASPDLTFQKVWCAISIQWVSPPSVPVPSTWRAFHLRA